MKRYIFSFLIWVLFWQPSVTKAQESLLQGGPMVGYSEMQEVMLWVQTTRAASVRIQYWEKGQPTSVYRTDNIITRVEDDYTAKLLADDVEPGKDYVYQLLINSIPVDLPYETSFQTLPIWKWRTDPPDFTFAAGSCAYINEPEYDRPGEPYGGEFQIFHAILKSDPDFMVWLGDNIYFREPDWNTRTGILHRYTHDRSLPALQPLLGSVHHYAIWDDHDYGPNNSDRSWWNKEATMDAFQLFWPNPSFGVAGIEGAITFFQWGDCDFFLLDNRSYRSPNLLESDHKTILGPEQLQWLFDELVSSQASFKFVAMGGQLLNTEARNETYSNYGFDKEREQIISFIQQQGIRNVVFLTGDRHYAELSKLEEPGKPVIYDLTTSPLTAGPFTDAVKVDNKLRVEGTLAGVRNFALLEVNGPARSRSILIRVFNSGGQLIWDYTIHQE